MAIILCSYCISSIRAARREAQVQPAQVTGSQRRGAQPDKDSSWIQQALEERRAEKDRKWGKSNG
ncbi:hypothetical protein N7492_002963 [Penicillium capsulatum]|uniref:Uncharacterized protein n=1 Tax=Penicillium capsulatum TaxID=69766 RepID=A0A9W9LVR3_9EURO|nr:hypothetical protein N7492_002963 [Penicillium capsulatum]KAJ6122446.1 hypothetical protein N7512_004911 [Penicillium capsulatum]